MRKDIRRKSIGRICTLVVVGMFIAVTSLSVSANDPDDWTYGGDSWGADGRIGSNDNYAVIIETNGNDRMTIANDGKVGIGTTSPSYELTVEADRTVDTFGDGQIRIQGATDDNKFLSFRLDTSANAGRITAGDDSPGLPVFYPLLLNPGGGNVGIRIGNPSTTLHVDGDVAFGDGSELTITSDAVTATDSYHTIDTEGNAGTDDLVTINGGSVAGEILIIRADNSGRTVVVRDGTGNLQLSGDITLNNAEDTLTLIFDGNYWLELSHSDNGP